MAPSTARASILAISTVLFNRALAVRLGDGDKAAHLDEDWDCDDDEDGGAQTTLESLVVEEGDAKAAEYDESDDPPSGTKCESGEPEWGTDTAHGNPEMKAYLGNCTDQVEMNADNVKLLKNYGCHSQFDVVTWNDIQGLLPPHRKPKTGGIVCAKAFTFKRDPPSECFNPDRPHVLSLYAAVSGTKGPKPVHIPSIKEGGGLNSLQSNYTWMIAQHPRAWDSRSTLRKDLSVCRNWNAMDTVIEMVAKGESASSNLHIIVGPSDENKACKGKKLQNQFVASHTLKALICIYPLKNYFKAVDVQEIKWHPPGTSA